MQKTDRFLNSFDVPILFNILNFEHTVLIFEIQLLLPSGHGLSPLTQYKGTVGGSDLGVGPWYLSVVGHGGQSPQCQGMKLVELWESSGQWKGIELRICPCPYSLSIIQFSESFNCLQTYTPTHAHSVARVVMSNYCRIYQHCCLTSFHLHNERLQMRCQFKLTARD